MPSNASINSDDYYTVLGVDRSVSDADLAKAYKKLALKHHPDKNPDRKEQAEEEFKKISEAYDVLRCPEKRKEYDQYGKNGPSCMDGQGNPQDSDSNSFFTPNGRRPQRTTMSREEADKIFMNFFPGGSPFADIFGSGTSPFGFRTAGPSSGGFQGFGSEEFSSGGLFGGMNFGTAFPRTSTNQFRPATTSRTRAGAGHRGKERARSRRAHSRPQSQQQRSLDHHVLAKGTAIVVQGLTTSPEHNGKNGHVVAWDASRGRYEVRLLGDGKMGVGDDAMRLRPQNITQLCTVEVTGLTTRPQLNGMSGDIFNYCKSKRRYLVVMSNSGSTVSLQPANCILSCDTCVLLDGLNDQAWNGQRARIISIDRSVGRYTVECESGAHLKVKYDNVLC